MTTRRSKRLLTKEPPSVAESFTDSPVLNKKLKSAVTSNPKKETAASRSRARKPSVEPVTDSKTVNCSQQKRTRGKTKSSYFESPDASEKSESAESDYESDSEPVRKRTPRNTNNVSQSKKKPTYESESDSSSDEFVKPGTSQNSLPNSSLVDKLAQPIKKSYESESDSSSDEPTKHCVRKESSESAVILADELDSNDTTADSTTAEYFDFTPLLSQVTQANNEESTADVKPVIEKQEPKKNAPTPAKKPKRGKRPATSTQVPQVKAEQMEVFELLAMGENTDLSANDIKESVSKATEEYEIPKQVEVLLDAPLVKKKKRCDDLEMALRRRLNNIRRENQVYIHKVHALCWIGHGNHVNSVLNSSDILGLALSLLPSEKCYPPKRMNMEYLEDLINWFNKKVKLRKDHTDRVQLDLCVSLQSQLQKQEAETKLDLCFMFICVIRALGIKCRLIINLNVAPIKPTSEQLLPVTQKKEDELKPKANIGETSKSKSNQSVQSIQSTKSSSEKKSGKKTDKPKNEKPTKNESKANNSKTEVKEKSKNSKNVKKQVTKEDPKGSRRSTRLVNSKSEYFEGEVSEEEKVDKKRTSRTSKSSERAGVKKTALKANKKANAEASVEEMSSSDSDFDSADDFVTPKKKRDRRVLSSDDESEVKKPEVKSNKPQNKMNYWTEVYLEAEEKWASVDIYKKSYLCDEDLYKNASHPVRYILAWNSDHTVKDVTRRYVPQYLTVTRKLRIDDSWWMSTLLPFKPPSTPQDREEDEELEKKLEELPLPTSISEYKNHPLYALERHLLKFQAIYPPDAPTVGFIKGEPVYSRLCVHQLHGREMWIKEAKVVKLNEKPYKIVKGRQKRDKFGTGEGPKDLELFGIWQVEDYVPPTAQDGKVPRNAFGNVELFKPSMLPKGTVYLQIPGLQRIANKLNIDCAAAITGFEYSTNGWSYPVKDGFVVCEEFKDILLDAFNQEVEEAEKKEKQKREERVFGNWKRLIKGLFIAERLKRKYNFGDPGTSKTESKEKKESKK